MIMRNFTAVAGLVEIRRRISHRKKMTVPNFTSAAGIVEIRRRISHQRKNLLLLPASSRFAEESHITGK
jgi:hypothetical protein